MVRVYSPCMQTHRKMRLNKKIGLIFKLLGISSLVILIFSSPVASQSFLPPGLPWKGKSEVWIAQKQDPWITPAEKSDFAQTASYSETEAFLQRLCSTSPLVRLYPPDKGRIDGDILYVYAGKDLNSQPPGSSKRKKPLLFVQAGIHSGEIDGCDAGLMLLRDIALGKKSDLLEKTDLLFIPILNTEGHRMASPHNRPNQRGPENMGLRTNASNLNLNRDFMKVETYEIMLVLNLIKKYNPTLYMDIHVTDGADYQYDITFGYTGKHGHSPGISSWLDSIFSPAINGALTQLGHIPGPFLNATNEHDFSDGNTEFTYGPNFSHGYGDLRHLPTVLVENHSLKPFKQRVLGTYALMESALTILATNGKALSALIEKDKARRDPKVPIRWRIPAGIKPDSMLLLGVQSRMVTSAITGADYVEWLGIPESKKTPYFRQNEAFTFLSRPKGYYIPAHCHQVIEVLERHGIVMEVLEKTTRIDGWQYKMNNPVFASKPFEGRILVSADYTKHKKTQRFEARSRYVPTDQPLGDLAMVLLEPDAPESLFQWGYFNTIFQRTEYAEDYFLEPLAEQMLKESPKLKQDFEDKKKQDPAFAKNPAAIREWFYAQSPYYDQRYLWYPVVRVE